MNNIAFKIAKNTFFNFINRTVGFISALLLSIIVARFLGPNRFGTYSLVAFTFILADIFSTAGLGMAGTKYISEYSGKDNKDLRSGIFLYILKFKLITTAIVVTLLITTAPYIAKFYGDKQLIVYIIISAINLIPSGLVAIFVGSITGLQEYKYLTYRTLMIAPITLIFYFLVLKSGYGIVGLIIINVIISIIEAIFYLSLIREHFNFNTKYFLSTQIHKRLLKYNWQVGLLFLTDAIVWQRSQVFFLGRFYDASEIAFYAIAFGIVEKGMTFIPSIFSSVLMPAMSELNGVGKKEDLNNLYSYSFKYIFLFVLPIFFILFVLSNHIISLLYGKDYLKAAAVLRILLISGFFRVIGSPSAGIIYSLEKQNFLLKVNSVLSIVIIVVNLLLIPKFGAIGAAISHAFAQTVLIVIAVTFVYKVLLIKFPIKETLNIILASAIAVLFGSFIVSFKNNLVAISISILLSLIVYIALIIRLRVLNSKDLKLFSMIFSKFPSPFCNFSEILVNWNLRYRNG